MLRCGGDVSDQLIGEIIACTRADLAVSGTGSRRFTAGGQEVVLTEAKLSDIRVSTCHICGRNHKVVHRFGCGEIVEKAVCLFFAWLISSLCLGACMKFKLASDDFFGRGVVASCAPAWTTLGVWPCGTGGDAVGY